jgi:ABC-type multidrug transport system ATPase subunit
VLDHAAAVRMPPSTTAEQRSARVDAVLAQLNLTHVQHTVIGDEGTRGVSGGERKRVNIGIELLADPLVLFADEPTTGLDSTAALK